ncbi:MAG: hypothetical protein HKN82_15805 [Akkermansiaceae bacterium]|nr:hypothetical protein [Akkermansiaceae bacterium]NNM28447.1 hypothetical protein [Akkermansiaceae bacterium]
MKTKFGIALICAALSASSLAFEQREFHSADGTKSFKALPIGYDKKTKIVTVRKTAGAEIRFKAEHLSEEDRKFLEENADALEASQKLNLDFDIFNGERETIRTDSERTVKTPAGYEIKILNRSKRNIDNVEVEYTIFHRKDAENGPGSIAQTSGSLDISTLFAGREDLNKTRPITLVRYSRQKSGGG